ncbi:hypothetical protein F5I97DRAFT_47606 [Phlebopus sp. FC_14]|nr:hypothetical protein F5I97DRAFT_47606 [Phlebopus sp. FC_14]
MDNDQVCHVRPKYSRGGKSYPTCGLTCAAKLNPRSGPVEMCDYCHQRPKFFDGQRTYPQCGRTCRDKARKLAASRGSGVPTYTAGNNSLCLMCWKAPKGGDSHFCSRSCSGAATNKAPLLLEAPRGHVTFERVANSFVTSWTSNAPSPEVKKVYKIIQKPIYATDYDKYRAQVDPSGTRSPGKANEFRRWHGIVRDCDVGSGGNVNTCSSKTCMLCQILQSTFDTARYPGGAIHSSITSDMADKHSRSARQSSSKAMLLVNVAAGRAMKATRSEFRASGGAPRGYDSVEVVGSHNGKSVIEDLIVYTGSAVRPSYLVIYG